ncbi:hypothetical protein [Pectinatus frisingensis]|uniref:hypothetical protein n=1 Tax=Pectinatus frisingensis TaxID=865 RepID=UPI0018C65138|nr:hypothetical protein [Pectinatus frisingensis]
MNEIILVNTKKVAKQTKIAGEFMMFKCSSGNLLVTSQFILNLTDEQFFSIQCKLELPELATWWTQIKQNIFRSENREPELDIWEERYNNFLNDVDSNKALFNTQIILEECYLFADGFTYTAINQERLNMLSASENIRKSGRMIVIDGLQVIAPVTDTIWQKNDYLYKLQGMRNLEKEE